MYMRIRKAREDAGYTRETFAELLDVSVSYMAEVERGRTGISVKMLIKICKVLGLSADYVLFGETRTDDELRVDRIRRIAIQIAIALQIPRRCSVIVVNDPAFLIVQQAARCIVKFLPVGKIQFAVPLRIFFCGTARRILRRPRL